MALLIFSNNKQQSNHACWLLRTLSVAGSMLLTIGSGFIFTIGTRDITGQWTGYYFLSVFGAGICRYSAFSAIPLVLEPAELATASIFVAFYNSLGCNLAVGIGQSIFTMFWCSEFQFAWNQRSDSG
jgi:hypothetical protein